jgi:hypothetical protein
MNHVAPRQIAASRDLAPRRTNVQPNALGLRLELGRPVRQSEMGTRVPRCDERSARELFLGAARSNEEYQVR